MSTSLYRVHIWSYAERHFIKAFEKKYPRAWDITFDAICTQLSHIDSFLTTTKAERICSCPEKKKFLLKCEFAVAGTRESPHASGNRYIVYLDEEKNECHILLLYAKDHYSWQETNWWKQQIKENYPDMRELFTSL